MANQRVFISVLILLWTSGAAFAREWITEPLYSEFHVVVAADAPPVEVYAAREFQRYWQLSTGHAVTRSNEEEIGKVNVWIGPNASRFAEHMDLSKIGHEGYKIQTFRYRHRIKRISITYKNKSRFHTEFRHLGIAGGGPQGTLYGVYTFFRDYMGLRWPAPGRVYVPETPAVLPAIKHKHNPGLAYRAVLSPLFADNPGFAAIHGLNGSVPNTVKDLGWFINYAGDPAQTLHDLVDPGRYFPDHPYYFGLTEGGRSRDARLCLSNREARYVAARSLRRLLLEVPQGPSLAAVAPADWPYPCQCEPCAELIKNEGGDTDALLQFINELAAATAGQFPQAYIEFAPRPLIDRAPKHARPRTNVVVRPSTENCDFSSPIEQRGSVENKAFRNELSRWAETAEHIHVYDRSLAVPPWEEALDAAVVLESNLQFYRKNNVGGLSVEVSNQLGHEETLRRAYVAAGLLRDPKATALDLAEEFHQSLPAAVPIPPICACKTCGCG